MNLQLSQEEALALHAVLKSNWIPIELQRVIYDLIRRIEKELEIE
jgi:hypothetical protein